MWFGVSLHCVRIGRYMVRVTKDHQTLRRLLNFTDCTGRLGLYRLLLVAFASKLQYNPAPKQNLVDVMSRPAIDKNDRSLLDNEIPCFFMEESPTRTEDRKLTESRPQCQRWILTPLSPSRRCSRSKKQTAGDDRWPRSSMGRITRFS